MTEYILIVQNLRNMVNLPNLILKDLNLEKEYPWERKKIKLTLPYGNFLKLLELGNKNGIAPGD